MVRGHAPPALLSVREEAVLSGYSVLKRRQDWLLGRWTLKLLLQEIIRQKKGRTIPLDTISILPGRDGAPRVSFDSPDSDLDLSFSVSISHSHGMSLCAAVTRQEWPLGADIEFIEPRSHSFAADFFSEEEQAQISEQSPQMHETMVTAIWSGKESALKAIREGLRSDTRSVSCHFERQVESMLVDSLNVAAAVDGNAAVSANWRPFRIRWEREEDKKQHPPLEGWWMVTGQFVLTMAAGNQRLKK